MRATRPYTYLGTAQGMCRQCGALVPARILEDGGAVYQERLCPTCGPARARIADSVEWYLERMATPVTCTPVRHPRDVREGCPRDCGPCAMHANACHLPVFSITNVCNMNCPVCFTYNRADRQYYMTREELARILDRVLEQCGPLDLINITGGEPTLHPGLPALLAECRRPEIGRVTVNSNGLRLAEDTELCAALAEAGAYVVLSFDTFHPQRSMLIHGRDVVDIKLRALENLERADAGVTLLHVMIRGINDDEMGSVLALARSHSVVRSITVQTMTYTGRGGRVFMPREVLPLDGAAEAIETATGGRLRARDFIAHPSTHPLCYSVAYYLRGADRWHSFTDMMAPDDLRRLLVGSYLLRPGEDAERVFRAAIDRLWANGDNRCALPALRGLLERLYPAGRALSPFERQARAESSILAVYLHAHMDEDTLDLARLAVCPDQVPDADGRMIPACAYNLFYRQYDPRFWIMWTAAACCRHESGACHGGAKQPQSTRCTP